MKRIVLAIALACFYAMLSSCNIASAIQYVTMPDPEQEVLFELSDVPTVVFVDDRRNIMHPTRLRRVIAEQVTDELLAKKLLTIMISPRDAMRVSSTNDKYNEPLPVDELGKAVGATVVIYIEMVSFGLTSDGQTANPRASCNIRVINTKDRTRLFPTEQAAFIIPTSIQHVSPNRVTSSSDARELAEELAVKLAGSVTKVFYTHNTGRLGDHLERK